VSASDCTRTRDGVIVAGGRVRFLCRICWNRGATIVAPGAASSRCPSWAGEGAGELIVSMTVICSRDPRLAGAPAARMQSACVCVARWSCQADARLKRRTCAWRQRRGLSRHARWPADADGYAGSLSCAHEVTAVAETALRHEQPLSISVALIPTSRVSTTRPSISLSVRLRADSATCSLRA